MVNLRKYVGKFFIKLADIQDGPIERAILDVEDGSYDKADLVLDGGERLSLNATNFRTLFKAFGDNPVDWIGKRVELFEGELPFNGQMQRGIRVRAISPPAPKKPAGAALNDEINF
jgi:hypothetical protein